MMASSQLLGLAFISIATVGQCMAIRGTSIKSAGVGEKLPWVQNVSHMIALDAKIKTPEKKTAIVTFAGKRNLDYIDGAVLLGRSVQEHAPGYMMVAIVIENMKDKHQETLRKAGWKLVVVPNWDRDYCGEDCDPRFLGRWHDSFEKINVFRLPFQKVLFLDSDTYVFNDRIQELLTQTKVPDGHIAMARDGCKEQFNSGVMLFKPNLDVFMGMLKLVTEGSREQILDQELVNAMYKDKIVEVPREFNCVDILGVAQGMRKECEFHCSKDVVISHFTGYPKPTQATRRRLEIVRRPGAPDIACTNKNFGSCRKWSSYYCDIRKHSKYLTKELQAMLKTTGECCHTPFDPTQDTESCKECVASLNFSFATKPDLSGTFVRTTLKPTLFNGRKPIYVNLDEHARKGGRGSLLYMYYVEEQKLWMMGYQYTNNMAQAFFKRDAQCPRDFGWMHTLQQNAWREADFSVATVPNEGAPADTEHVSWNMESNAWEVFQDHSMDEEDEASGAKESAQKSEEKAKESTKPQSKSQAEKQQDDGPGQYIVVSAGPSLKALPVSKEFARTSAKVGEVALQQEVEVMEVAAELNDGRKRARIANPEGWITLMTAKTGARFAKKV
jgi:hypothetical protein